MFEGVVRVLNRFEQSEQGVGSVVSEDNDPECLHCRHEVSQVALVTDTPPPLMTFRTIITEEVF